MNKLLLSALVTLTLSVPAPADELHDLVQGLNPQQRQELQDALKDEASTPTPPTPSGTHVFDKWLSEDSPLCVPVSDFKKVSTVTDLTPAQFQFVRALFVAMPPISRKLPPGDHAVMAAAGKTVMLALVDGVQSCARFLAPDFIQSMLTEVGAGKDEHIGPNI